MKREARSSRTSSRDILLKTDADEAVVRWEDG